MNIVKPVRASLQSISDIFYGGDKSKAKEAYAILHDDKPGKIMRLSAIGLGYGGESARMENGEYLDFLNMGDTYAKTLCFFRGGYRLCSWGDIVEQYDR